MATGAGLAAAIAPGSAAAAESDAKAAADGTTKLKIVIARPYLYFYPGEELASDEMRVTILGSGWGNIVRRTQAACSIFVELGNRDSFVFDMGQGTMINYNSLHIIDGAISYRLDWNGMSFVWSGDTNPNHFFVDNAKGADIILHETAPIAARFAQAANVPKKIADNIIAASHIPAKAYGKVLSLTKLNLAVTNHCPIDAQEITEIVKDISVHWKGPYQVGQDFMVFNISKSKKEILVRQAAVNDRSWSPNVEKAKGKIPLNPTDYRSE